MPIKTTVTDIVFTVSCRRQKPVSVRSRWPARWELHSWNRGKASWHRIQPGMWKSMDWWALCLREETECRWCRVLWTTSFIISSKPIIKQRRSRRRSHTCSRSWCRNFRRRIEQEISRLDQFAVNEFRWFRKHFHCAKLVKNWSNGVSETYFVIPVWPQKLSKNLWNPQ